MADKILLEHGDGGLLTNRLITETFLPLLKNDVLERMDDSAVLKSPGAWLCFTTDSYVVQPCFFPGGDIGSLAVHGTVNDLAVCGGTPLHLSAALIIEEGFAMDDLRVIIASMAEAARSAGVGIVTGDTKVVPRGAADGIFITTAGIGAVSYSGTISAESVRPGDAVILNGPIGNHGAAILSKRENLQFSSDIRSDSAPLNGLVNEILAACPRIHCMRDATRGGLGAVLAEIAHQSGLRLTVSEKSIPVDEAVRGACEILGLDPLFLANEGKMAVFCPADDAGAVLAAMQSHEYGRAAAVIGHVAASERGCFVMDTVIGGQREIDLPSGELVPRIC